MPQIKIYRSGKLLEERKFRDGFFINFLESELCWQFGTEGWRTEQGYVKSFESLNTTWATWLTKVGSKAPYYIEFVRPDWTLKVNDTFCERGFYLPLAIVWRQVDLIYRDYQFNFLFIPEETTIEDNTPLPKPDILASAIPNVDDIFPKESK